MNNNISFERAISNLHSGQSLIHFYGSHAIKIGHDAQGGEQVVLKSLPVRIALYIQAAFIYYTGTAQYFNPTIAAHQYQQQQLEDFLNRNFTVMTNEIGQMEGLRAAAILQNGYYEHLAGNTSLFNKMQGWNSLNTGESALMRYAGYGFAPNWKTGHTFSQIQIDTVGAYNNMNTFQYAKAHIAECSDNALIYFMDLSIQHRNEIIELLPLDRLERFVSCPKRYIADACKQKIVTLVLNQLLNENWPEDAVELLRQGQYSPWLYEKFKKLGYQDYEKNPQVFTSIGEMLTILEHTETQRTALKAFLYKLVKIVETNSAIYTIDVELQVFAILCRLFRRETNAQLHTAPFIRNETVGEIFFKSRSQTIKTTCCEHIKTHYQETKESLLEKYLTRLATPEMQYGAITEFLDSWPVALINESIKKLNVSKLLFMAIDNNNLQMESYCLAILLQEKTLLEKFLIELTTQEPNVERKLEKEDLEKLQLGFIDRYIKYFMNSRLNRYYDPKHSHTVATKLAEQSITYCDNALNLIYQTIKKWNLAAVYQSNIALPSAFDNEAFSDFTITIKDLDGESILFGNSIEVKVNSMLLSARYNGFAKLIEGAQDNRLEITAIDIEAMKDIIEFFYTHEFSSGIGYDKWSIYCKIARQYNATQLIDALCKEVPVRLYADDMNYLESHFWLLQNTSDQSFIVKMCEYFDEQFESNLKIELQNINAGRKILRLAEATMQEAKGPVVIALKKLIQNGVTYAIACLMNLQDRRNVAAKSLMAFIKEYHTHIEELDCSRFYHENKFMADLFAALPNLKIFRVGRENTVSSLLALAIKQHAKQLKLVDLSSVEAANLIESDTIFATLQEMVDIQVLTEGYNNGYDPSDDDGSQVEDGDNADEENINNSDEEKDNDALPEYAQIAKNSDQKSANNLD